jgi:hypothetical protein
MRHKVRPAALLLRTPLVLAVSAVVAGVLAGLLSRGVMRVASLIDAAPGVQGFTWDGSLRLIRDVVLLYSAPATLLFALTRRVLPGSWLRKGVLFGGLLSLVFLVAQLRPEMLLVKFLFALVSIVYGVTLAFLVTALEARARRWIPLSLERPNGL